jgi:hypothetical protein
MATHPHTGRRAGSSLNLALAALMAAAAAFVTYAMPDHIFSQLVVASGLPSLVAAAQPPLGMTARAAALAAGAVLSFAAVFALLRALDRASAVRPRMAGIEAPAEAPRLRRADAHPDAPARRPLLAGRDLSEPVEPIEAPAPEAFEEGEEPADSAPRPLPSFLVVEDSGEPGVEAEPLLLEEPAADSIDALVSQLPEVAEEGEAEPIPNLMRRLEFGLARRERAAAAGSEQPEALPESEAPKSSEAPAPAAVEPQVGHRLRNAIDGLQKMAARGG